MDAIADFCTKQRKHPSVQWARYFWSGPSEIVILSEVLSEVDGGANPAQDPEILLAKMKIDDLAHMRAYEIWAEVAP